MPVTEALRPKVTIPNRAVPNCPQQAQPPATEALCLRDLG